jgi:hypothetical protein
VILVDEAGIVIDIPAARILGNEATRGGGHWAGQRRELDPGVDAHISRTQQLGGITVVQDAGEVEVSYAL